jgi:hypothetical protein
VDIDLLEDAREAADWLLIHQPDSARQHVARWLAGRQEYIKA